MASLRPDSLPAALERSLAPVYLLGGAEPLLIQECRDAIIRAAQAQGFTERNVIETGPRFDWAELGSAPVAPSLFATRQILDLRIPTGKPGADGSRAIKELLAAPDPDVLLLVSTGDWSGAIRNSAWVKALSAAGTLVEIWPVKAGELPDWIRGRLRQAGLDADRDAVALLAELVEGNLLAAQQEIDKLLLTGAGPHLSVDDVRAAVADSARSDAFRLAECMLGGQGADGLRAVAVLQRTGVAIQWVVGALNRELSIADGVRAAVAAGKPEAAAFRSVGVWPARQDAMRRALRRLDASQFGDVFRALSLIDRQSKGRAAGDPWQTLDRLVWFMCQPSAANRP
jgi:DNA polymerase-3 subunit delta